MITPRIERDYVVRVRAALSLRVLYPDSLEIDELGLVHMRQPVRV